MKTLTTGLSSPLGCVSDNAMSRFYPDGIPLSQQQLAEDFEAANPGKTAVFTPHPQYTVNAIKPFEEGETEMPSEVKVTVHDVDTFLRFGKYKPKNPGDKLLTIEQVLTKDPGYLIWCHENIEWFALTEDLYKDACILDNVVPDNNKLKKATQMNEQPSKSPTADLFDQDDTEDEDKNAPPF